MKLKSNQINNSSTISLPILHTKPSPQYQLLIEKLKCIGSSTQIILVTNEDRSSNKAKLILFEKKNNKWIQVGSVMEADIGKNGFKPVKKSRLSESEKQIYKHEGDYCSPIGAYTIDTLFGWGENQGFDLPYITVTEKDYWVSDRVKEKYNVWINNEGGPDKDWDVYEELKIEPYKYAGIINYNMGSNKIVGNGSAIFLHIKTESGYTAGCTAVSENDLIFILKWMKKDCHPILIAGPQSEVIAITGN